VIGTPTVRSESIFPRKNWNVLSSAPDTSAATQTFRVTHPFHPLCGRELALITHRHNWAEDRVYFNDDGGVLRGIPASWTSILEPDPVVAVGKGRSAFRVSDLLQLVALVAGVAGDRKGRNHGKRRSV